ncbi:MAG: hypothetical protein KDA22_07840 [Phycisphaerales bacterium]|nr:hypothetical protein [Phycisphaerales bacterium]
MPRRAMATSSFRPTTLLVGALIVGVAASLASATTRYVAPCGNDAWAGVSVSCVPPLGPKHTIQAALADSSDGDQILVLPGVYAGPIDLDGKAVHLKGIGGAAATVVNGNGSGPVVLCNSLEGADSIIEGLTIAGGDSASTGGGMLIALSSPTVVDCAFTGNHAATKGGGVAVTTGSPHFSGCAFVGNTAGNEGGGVATNFGLPVFEDCLFENNASFLGGGIATSGGSPLFVDCAVRDNNADLGAGMHCSLGAPTVEGSIIEDNNATQDGGGVLALGTDLALDSTTISGNIADNWGGGLAVFDGAVDATDTAFLANEADYGGGVYAVGGAELSFVACTAIGNHAIATVGGIGSVDSSLLLLGCTIEANTSTTIGGLGVSGGEVAAIGCTIADNLGNFAGGGMGLGSLAPDEAVFQLCSLTGNLGGLGGGAVLLLDGAATFEACTFTENAAASGGAIADLSEVFGGTLRLRDCLFNGNQSNLGGGAVRLDSYVALDAVRCRFLSNTVAFSDGGAVYTTGTTLRLVSCELIGNSAAGSGGAVHATGVASIVNCVLADNHAEDDGGALWLANLTGGEVTSCTLTANTALGDGGAVHAFAGQPVPIANSIVWGNGTPQISGDAFTTHYSIVPLGVAGPGCFNANPKFVAPVAGNYRLAATSPAIDAGLEWLLPVDAADADDDGDVTELIDVDRDGDPRVASGSADADTCTLVLDLGAYESAGAAPAVPTLLGDLNHDGIVGAADLGLLLAAWGPAPGCPAADLNGDGVVNGADLALVLAAWG